MPGRVIKESIWTSPNLNKVSPMAELHFYRLLPLPDDHGCCELTAAVVKGRCYPLRDKVTASNIEKWTDELVAADIVRVWAQDGRLYGWFPTWKEHQRVRSLHQRRTPEPPTSVNTCRQVTSDVRLNPNPNLNLNLNPHTPKGGAGGFDQFWKTYPKRVSKGQAEKAWNKLRPNEQLQETILASLGRAKTSDQWAKDQGRFIPHPATWLNAKGWEDEPVEAVKPKSTLELIREMEART